MNSPKPPCKKSTSLALFTLATLTFYGLAARLSYAPPPRALAATLCLPQCLGAEVIHATPADTGTGTELGTEEQVLPALLPPDFIKDDITLLIEKADHRLI